MREWITAFFMAWGMFLAIPCPCKRWDERARQKMLVCLPLVGLVVGGVGRPDDDRAARDGQITVVVEAVARGRVGGDRAARDRHGEAVAREVGVCGVQTLVLGEDADIAGENVQRGRFETLVARLDGDARPRCTGCADVHHVVTVDGVVAC